jgi:hypothetical protein
MSADNDWANGGGCFDKSIGVLIIVVMVVVGSIGWTGKLNGRAAVKRRG